MDSKTQDPCQPRIELTDHILIEEWIEELDLISDKQRVSYKDIKPVLDYLQRSLEVNPTRILNQWVDRYVSGELGTVSEKIYDRALKLKERTEKALRSGSRFKIEKLREEIYGKRDGLTLYSETEGQLEFLQRYGRKSPKHYLGRSISNYMKRTDSQVWIGQHLFPTYTLNAAMCFI